MKRTKGTTAPARPKLDPDAPFTEGHAVRTATAFGYPIRPEPVGSRIIIELESHGLRKDGHGVSTYLRVRQSNGPGPEEDKLELWADDLDVFVATLQRAISVARADGVLDPWVSGSHAGQA